MIIYSLKGRKKPVGSFKTLVIKTQLKLFQKTIEESSL